MVILSDQDFVNQLCQINELNHRFFFFFLIIGLYCGQIYSFWCLVSAELIKIFWHYQVSKQSKFSVIGQNMMTFLTRSRRNDVRGVMRPQCSDFYKKIETVKWHIFIISSILRNLASYSLRVQKERQQLKGAQIEVLSNLGKKMRA